MVESNIPFRSCFIKPICKVNDNVVNLKVRNKFLTGKLMLIV